MTGMPKRRSTRIPGMPDFSNSETTRRIKALEDRANALQTALNIAAGYISATDEWADKHPQDVLDWLLKGVTGGKNE